MKKEASVILAKCAQDKLYGIRIEKRDNDWVRTWAFKLKEETAEKEGFDKINFTGSFYTDEEYPGCPYCGAKKCFVCGNCGKVSCYDGSDKVVCNWCGSNGTAADDDGKLCYIPAWIFTQSEELRGQDTVGEISQIVCINAIDGSCIDIVDNAKKMKLWETY